MDFSDQQALINAVIHFLIASKYSVPFWFACLFIILFANRRASVSLLWRNLHLIEDLVLEKEFLSKIDVPLRLLTLSLIAVPIISVLPEPFHFYLGKLFSVIIPVLFLQLFAAGVDLIIFQWYFEKHRATNLPAVFRVLTLSFIWIIFTLVLLEYAFGVNLLPLIATSTVATAVLGLALQDTLKNLFAGLTVSLEKRFQHGDWVSFRLDGTLSTVGEISEIGWRTTRLKTLDDSYAVIPNVMFTSNHVVNFSRPLPCYARTIEFPVELSANPKLIQQALLQSAQGLDGIVDDPAIEAIPCSVTTDRVVYRLRFWIKEFDRGDEISGKAIENCLIALQKMGVVKMNSTAVGSDTPAPDGLAQAAAVQAKVVPALATTTNTSQPIAASGLVPQAVISRKAESAQKTEKVQPPRSDQT
jgi:small-conductance mechanosensitive channel